MKCKDCEHWTRETPKIKFCNLGRCLKLETLHFQYYYSTMQAMKEIESGKIVSDNLYTHEDFGCIHFKGLEIIQCMSCEKTIPKQESLVFCGECGR